MNSRRKFIKTGLIFVPAFTGIVVPSFADAVRRRALLKQRVVAAGGGPDSWYDTFSISGGSGWATVGAFFMEYKTGLVVSSGGTATKLRIRMRGGLSDETAKLAIYDNGGTLKGTCTTPTIAASSADTTYEIDLDSSFAISAADYTLAISASGSLEVRINADGAGNYATQSYAGFPPGSLPASEGAFDTVLGGVYVD